MRSVCAALAAMVAGGAVVAGVGCALDPGARTVFLDGDTADWPTGVAAAADDRWVFLRFEPGEGQTTLQSSPTPTRVLIDADADASTGTREGELGVEVQVTMSPEGTGRGVSVRTTGGATTHQEIGFMFSPTYKAGEYEARLLRTADPALARAGVCRGVVEGAGWSRAFELVLPEVGDAPERAGAAVPGKPEGCVRVVSWNVLRGSPEERPDAFARVLAALDPDVVLVQEFDGADGEALARWFNEHAGEGWTAHARASMGVGVATRHEMVARQAGEFEVEGEWPARCVAAAVRTPMGELLCASVHLKCCGSAGSEEDRRRERETRAIAAGLYGEFGASTPLTTIIGGDLNLVGSRPAIEILAAGTDVDGTDLVIADPAVLGDAAEYTWTDAKSAFSPGRLDYVLVGDAGAEIAGAFVLDASRLTDAALREAGIERGDTAVSDHLPVVVDVRIRR